MKNEFVTYEQALALKELGFDEPCFGYYNNATFDTFEYYDSENTNSKLQSDYGGKKECAAPLIQQAFRWFREKHKLKGHIEAVEYLDGTPDTYHWSIFNQCNSGYDQLTHEEAELECLKKLIEIVKAKKK